MNIDGGNKENLVWSSNASAREQVDRDKDFVRFESPMSALLSQWRSTSEWINNDEHGEFEKSR